MLFILLVSCIVFSSYGAVEAATNVNGTISIDTNWTKANSPYDLSGPILISNGVNLTIEQGVIVNLNGYSLEVYGALLARGSATEKVQFNGGAISFSSTSKDSLIDSAVLSGSILVRNSSPTITYSSINNLTVDGGSPNICYNTISGKVNINSGSPSICNNDINGTFDITGGAPLVNANIIDARIVVKDGTAVISGNKISDGIHADSRGGPLTIKNNLIYSKSGFTVILIMGIHADISENIIFGNNATGIRVFLKVSSAAVTNNQIYDCGTGLYSDAGATADDIQIVGNLVINNTVGMSVWTVGNVHDNTIAENSIGLTCAGFKELIVTHNNFQNNTKYNVKILHLQDLNAPDNWWGTTDASAIDQSMYDKKNEELLGRVNYIPFLTSPNTNSPSIPATPTPKSTSQLNVDSMVKTDTLLTVAIIFVLVIGASVVLSIYWYSKKRQTV